MPEIANNAKPDRYEFAGLRFILKDSKLVCAETQKEVCLRRNVSEFLLLLLEKPQKLVEYREFRDGVSAWTIYKDAAQLTRTIHVTKGELVKNLRSLRNDFDLIEAVPGKGYRLDAEVNSFYDFSPTGKDSFEKDSLDFPSISADENSRGRKFLFHHWRQAFFACSIYALLFVLALYIEIAYQFDTFKTVADQLTLPIFLGIWTTSIFGLFLSRMFSVKFLALGLILSTAVFLIAGVVLYFFTARYLPDFAVTQAGFQTHPATAAYLKNIFYFLSLGVFLIVLPFGIVAGLEREVEIKKDRNLNEQELQNDFLVGALMISPGVLLILTVIAMLVSLWATAHLLENLGPSRYTSLFVQLTLWRWFLYFGLAAECLIWYKVSLNNLKSKSQLFLSKDKL